MEEKVEKIKEMKISKEAKRKLRKEKKDERKKTIKLMIKGMGFFKNLKTKSIIFLILYVLIAMVGFFIPIITANLVTSITNIDVRSALFIACLFVLAKLFEILLHYTVAMFWRGSIRSQLISNIRKSILENIMKLQISNFDKNPTGKFQERLKNDPQNVAVVIKVGQQYFIELVTKIGIVFYVIYLNWIIGLIYLIGITLIVMIDKKVQEEIKKKDELCKISHEKVNSTISEIVRGIRDIKLLNIKRRIKKLTNEVLEEDNKKSVDIDTLEIKLEYGESSLIILTVGAVIMVGLYFVNKGIITSTELITLYLYNESIFRIIIAYSKLSRYIKQYQLAVERIFEFEDEEKFPKEQFGKVHLENFKGKIEFDNVTFCYGKNKKVLDKMSLSINPKQTVAIVGESGGGKSTALNLITKSYKVNEGNGKVLLDGIDINELDEETIRNNVSIITQAPYIFNMTIKENLLLVNPKATMDELDEVCKKACFYEFIMSLPDKYNSVIGEGGVNLSGGQKQRLAIARALLKKCKILIFDEATSSLDNVTQKEIQESIDNISKEYTIVIVAHRLSTIKNCEKIFMINDGQVVASGNHEELLNSSKEYRKLYKADANEIYN